MSLMTEVNQSLVKVLGDPSAINHQVWKRLLGTETYAPCKLQIAVSPGFKAISERAAKQNKLNALYMSLQDNVGQVTRNPKEMDFTCTCGEVELDEGLEEVFAELKYLGDVTEDPFVERLVVFSTLGEL